MLKRVLNKIKEFFKEDDISPLTKEEKLSLQRNIQALMDAYYRCGL